MGEYEGNSYNYVVMCLELMLWICVFFIEVYLLMIVLGIFGVYYFYFKCLWWGFFYFFIFGLFGVGWFIDIFRFLVLVVWFNNEVFYLDLSFVKKKCLDDVYVLWFLGGFIGRLYYIVMVESSIWIMKYLIIVDRILKLYIKLIYFFW